MEGVGQDPNQLRIYLTGKHDDWKPTIWDHAVIYGVVYETDSGVMISDHSELFGAVIAHKLWIGDSSWLHFDEALKDATDWPFWNGGGNVLLRAVSSHLSSPTDENCLPKLPWLNWLC